MRSYHQHGRRARYKRNFKSWRIKSKNGSLAEFFRNSVNLMGDFKGNDFGGGNRFFLSPVCDVEFGFVSKSLSFTMKLEELPAQLPSIENSSL